MPGKPEPLVERHTGVHGAETLRPQLEFDVFYREEYRAVLALALAVLRSPAAAEDVTQDAFLAVYKRWTSGVSNPSGYVRTAVMNRCRSAFRRRMVETRALLTLGRRRVEAVQLPESSRRFWDAVRALPARQAQAAALFYLEDRSVQDVSDILGMAEGTVKSHLYRARQTLAATMGVVDTDETDEEV